MPERASATLAEIDGLAEAIAGCRFAVNGVAVDDWLAKIRAHAEADELEQKRLHAELMLAKWATMEGVPADWRAAPQRAREKANAMPPVRICGEVDHG